MSCYYCFATALALVLANGNVFVYSTDLFTRNDNVFAMNDLVMRPLA